MSRVRANSITNKNATGAPNFTHGAIITGVATATGFKATGIVTAASFQGDGSALTGIDATALKDSGGSVKVQANTSGAVVTGVLTATGNVKVGGVLTYEDVTNVDSVGIVTAREGVLVGAGKSVGIGTVTPRVPLEVHNTEATGTFINVKSKSNTLAGINFGDFEDDDIGSVRYGNGDNSLRFFANAGSEKFRIGSAGQLGIGGATYGSSGQVLTSGGASAAPTWGSAGGITDFDEWYQSNQPAGDQDPIQTWARSSTASTKHGALGGTMSHSSGIWTFPSTGYWFISFTGWVFNQNRKNRYAQFRIQTTDNNSSYQEQAACSCRNEDDSGDGNGATYVSAHCQTIFNVTDTSLRTVSYTHLTLPTKA